MKAQAGHWRGALLAATLGLIAIVAGCTGTRVREFTRESYDPPGESTPVVRVFEAPRRLVWEQLLEVLERRGARLDWLDADAGKLVGSVPWAGTEEAEAAVDLGIVHKVVTRTERSYRSYSPLDFRCNDCVVRNGTITSEKTELVEDSVVRLAPSRYRVEAVLRASLADAADGTRVELSLNLSAVPREPPELLPRSTGHLETMLLDSLGGSLAPSGALLR